MLPLLPTTIAGSLPKPSWLAEKKVTILTQFGLSRHPEMPDVPMFMDLAKNEADKQALVLLLSRQEYSRPYYAPPQVPAGRLTMLRRAFDATMRDPAFVAEIEKQQLDLNPQTGEELQALFQCS